MGYRQHLQIHGVYRTDQLDIRLRDLRHDALRLRCLEQSVVVPDRMVRRIPSDPNPHHPHHQNGEDPVHREPCKPRAHCDDGDHLHGRNDVALHLGGFGVRLRAASLALLAAGRGHAGDIRNTHPPCESLVHSQVGTLRGIEADLATSDPACARRVHREIKENPSPDLPTGRANARPMVNSAISGLAHRPDTRMPQMLMRACMGTWLSRG